MELQHLPMPPDVAEDGDGDDEPCTVLHVSIHEDDGHYLDANIHIPTTDDDQIAAAIVQCIQGLAAMRGPGLQLALAKRLTIRED